MGLMPNDKSLIQIIDESFAQNEIAIYLKYRVSNDCKDKFASYITTQKDPNMFEGIKKNVEIAIDFFNKGRF